MLCGVSINFHNNRTKAIISDMFHKQWVLKQMLSIDLLINMVRVATHFPK